MNLNDETFKRVTALFGGKYANAEYNGCAMFTGNVCFILCNRDNFDYKNGVMVELSEDFEIKKVSRIGSIRSTGERNRPTERIQIPIL